MSGTWPDARAALAAALAAAPGVDRVLIAPPTGAAAMSAGVTVMMTPPARSTVRSPGGRTEVRYTLNATVLRLMGGDPEASSLEVDDAVEAINVVMEAHVTLGGTATVAGAFDWAAAVVVEYPPGSGVWFIGMTGTTTLIIVRDYLRAA